MNNKFFRLIALLVCASMVMSLAACGGEGSSSDVNSSSSDLTSSDASSNTGSEFDDAPAINDNAMTNNIQNKVFPMFKNTVDYTRGGATSADEAYQDYKKYV